MNRAEETSMGARNFGGRRGWVAPAVLLGTLAVVGLGLATWKITAMHAADTEAASQPEWTELVTAVEAVNREHRSSTTAIGTVLALRSVTLRNEVSGTVRVARLTPGQIVDAGTVLVALDVSVEEAELQALEAQAALAGTLLERMRRASESRAVSALEVDRARAERDIALAQIARLKAVIERKTIRAPFRARVGLADVHPGQYLHEGTLLTTLQGVDAAAHVEFSVAQAVASGLRVGERVEVWPVGAVDPLQAAIVAVDARIDPSTRNALVRVRIDAQAPVPGASVRVEVPVGAAATAVAVPLSALRKGPGGDHVFVIAPDSTGTMRAQERPVQSGTVRGDEVLLHSGVALGERVAAAGSFKLRDGVKVMLADQPVEGAADPR